MTRQSYSRRRIELRAKDVRAKKQAEGADERPETPEERANIEAFFAARGINLGEENKWKKELRSVEEDHYRTITVTVRNLKVKQLKSVPLVRKPQPEPEAKSMKAAYLREIAMAARRRGLIKDGYEAAKGTPMVQWEDAWDEF
jgi:hypothetical protein